MRKNSDVGKAGAAEPRGWRRAVQRAHEWGLVCAAALMASCGQTSSNSELFSAGGVGQGGGIQQAQGGGPAAEAAGRTGVGGVAGTNGTAGAAPLAAVTPEASALWRWDECGSIPPVVSSALQASYLPVTDEFAVLYADGRIEVFAPDAVRPKRQLRPPGLPVTAFAISLDGAWLAEAGGALRLRQIPDGGLQQTFERSEACQGSRLQFSADGKQLVAWGAGAACVWETSGGALLGSRRGDFVAAAISGGQLVTAEAGEELRIVASALTGLQPNVIALGVPPDFSGFDGHSLRFSPAGDTLTGTVTQNEGGYFAVLWSSTGAIRKLAKGKHAVYSPRGERVLLGSEIVDTKSGETERAVAESVYASPDSALASSGTQLLQLSGPHGLGPGSYGGASLVEVSSGKLLRYYGGLPPARSDLGVSALAVSPDGRHLITVSGAGLLWNVEPDFSESTGVGVLEIGVGLNASFSSDSSEVLVSGDGWAAFSTGDGSRLQLGPSAISEALFDVGCIWTSARFAPQSSAVIAGTWGPALEITGRTAGAPRSRLLTSTCNARGAANHAETLIATSDPALYRVADGTRVWPAQLASREVSVSPFADVQFAPGEAQLLLTRCVEGSLLDSGTYDDCQHSLHAVADGVLQRELPELTSYRAEFSSEGHWVLSGGTLLHLPSSRLLRFGDAKLASFAPNGDIIALREDQSLSRYCRGP